MSDILIDELLLFSDHHGHPFTFGAREVLYGNKHINSRLAASLDVLSQIHTYAKNHNIGNIVFCGDLFHVREAVPTDAVSLTVQKIAQMSNDAYVWLLPGNHDYFDREGKITSLDIFKHLKSSLNISVVGRERKLTSGVRGDTYSMHFCPYTDDRNLAIEYLQQAGEEVNKDTPALLFAHLGMQGAKVGSDYVLVSDQDITVSDVPYDKFAGCFFGHYHQHQQLFRNGWFVGATHHHNWGDVNTRRGFLHAKLYVDHVDFDFIETNAPRFLMFSDEDQVSAKPGDFVRVLTRKNLSEKQAAKLREQVGADSCELVYLPPEVEISNMELSEENLSPHNMLESWVAAHQDWLTSNMADIAHEDVVQYGRELLTLTEKI
ncbi:hypothetical protein HC928_02645 [bacterium]|nr:hypothetical protein [bacterium]